MDQTVLPSMNTSCYPCFPPYPYYCPTSKDDDDDDDKKSPWCNPWLCPPYNCDPCGWPWGTSGSWMGGMNNFWLPNMCPPEDDAFSKINVLSKLIGPQNFILDVIKVAPKDVEGFWNSFDKGIRKNFLKCLSSKALNHIYKELFKNRNTDSAAFNIIHEFVTLLRACGDTTQTDKYCPLADILTRGHNYTRAQIKDKAAKVRRIKSKGEAIAQWCELPQDGKAALNKAKFNDELFQRVTAPGIDGMYRLSDQLNRILRACGNTLPLTAAAIWADGGATQALRSNIHVLDGTTVAAHNTVKDLDTGTDVTLTGDNTAQAALTDHASVGAGLGRVLRILRHFSLYIPHLLNEDDQTAVNTWLSRAVGGGFATATIAYYPSSYDPSRSYERTYYPPNYRSYQPQRVNYKPYSSSNTNMYRPSQTYYRY